MNKLLALSGVALMLAVTACGDDSDNDNDTDLPTVPTGVVVTTTMLPTDSTMTVETMVTDSTGG